MEMLDPPIVDRVARAVDRFVASGLGDIAYLRGEDGELRLRIGNWRVRFTLKHQDGVMTIVSIHHRREAYRRR